MTSAGPCVRINGEYMLEKCQVGLLEGGVVEE